MTNLLQNVNAAVIAFGNGTGSEEEVVSLMA